MTNPDKKFYEIDLSNGSRANLLKVFAPIVVAGGIAMTLAFTSHEVIQDTRDQVQTNQ